MDKTPVLPKILMLLDNSFVSDSRVEKEAQSLITAGASITVVCLAENNLPEKDIRNGYDILRIIKDGYNSPLRKTYNSYIEQIVSEILKLKFDVIHCHDFYMLSIGVEVKKKRSNIKLIYDAHEYLRGWPFYKTSKGLNKWKGKLVWKRLIQNEKRQIQKADAVITITGGISNRLLANNNLKVAPTVIKNYPNKMALKVQEGYFHKKYNLHSEVKILVHSGTIYHTDKQLTDLFDIIEEDINLALVFIGNRPRFYDIESSLRGRDESSNRIFFHPYPNSQEGVINLLSAANVGLLHIVDKWEAHKIGFSNRFVEYIMAGLPVVATPQQFTRDFNISHECSTFYSGNNNEELKKAINIISTNFDRYKQNAMMARDTIDWQFEAEKLINLYEDLTNE